MIDVAAVRPVGAEHQLTDVAETDAVVGIQAERGLGGTVELVAAGIQGGRADREDEVGVFGLEQAQAGGQAPVLQRQRLDLDLDALDVAVRSAGGAGDGSAGHLLLDVQLQVLDVVVEGREVGIQAPAQPGRLQADLVVGQRFWFGLDDLFTHDGLVEAAGAEAGGDPDIAEAVVAEAVLGGDVPGGPGPVGILAQAQRRNHARAAHRVDAARPDDHDVRVAGGVSGGQRGLGDVLGFPGLAQAEGQRGTFGKAVLEVAEQREALRVLVPGAGRVLFPGSPGAEAQLRGLRIGLQVVVVTTEDPAQRLVGRRTQADLLGELVGRGAAAGSCLVEGRAFGNLRIEPGVAIAGVDPGDRGQGVLAQVPVQLQGGAVPVVRAVGQGAEEVALVVRVVAIGREVGAAALIDAAARVGRGDVIDAGRADDVVRRVAGVQFAQVENQQRVQVVGQVAE
ncbi:hypothetical protein D9M71_344030 [compost metagenome]